jgi:ribosome maturation protein Sdo1
VKEFDEDTERTWIIDKGSSMCLYDDRYFMLKIKESNRSSFKLIYNLPPAMDEKLKELIELARTPEEQQGMWMCTLWLSWGANKEIYQPCSQISKI